MKYHRILLNAGIGLAIIGMAGCASTGRVAVDDQTIANNIKQQLEAPTGPEGPFGIDILVHKGAVSLDGAVPSQAAKEHALQIGQSQEGVKDIKSFLELK